MITSLMYLFFDITNIVLVLVLKKENITFCRHCRPYDYEDEDD